MPNNAEEERLSPGSSISLPRGRKESLEGEATDLPGNVSPDLHLLGSERRRGEERRRKVSLRAWGEVWGAGSRRQPPPARSLQRLFHTSPFPSLPCSQRNPISPGSYECACLYFSLSKAMTTHTSLFFFLDVTPEIEA